MILDLILVALVALFVFIGYKRGLAKSLYGLIALIVAGICGFFLSRFVAGWIYDVFFAGNINESINGLLMANPDGELSSGSVYNNLPGSVKGFLGLFGANGDNFFDISQVTDSAARGLQNTVRAAIVSIISFILFVLIFVLILIVLKIFSKKILSLFNLPAIKQINNVLGGIFGLAQGLLICYILILVIKLILPATDSSLISKEMIDSSFVFSRIYYSGLF